jgi:hypothetical protein
MHATPVYMLSTVATWIPCKTDAQSTGQDHIKPVDHLIAMPWLCSLEKEAHLEQK